MPATVRTGIWPTRAQRSAGFASCCLRCETASVDSPPEGHSADMTGNDSPAVREAALQSECLAYLTKPFAARSLIEPANRVAAG
jgi:CheY-like chemotaxis protein